MLKYYSTKYTITTRDAQNPKENINNNNDKIKHSNLRTQLLICFIYLN